MLNQCSGSQQTNCSGIKFTFSGRGNLSTLVHQVVVQSMIFFLFCISPLFWVSRAEVELAWNKSSSLIVNMSDVKNPSRSWLVSLCSLYQVHGLVTWIHSFCHHFWHIWCYPIALCCNQAFCQLCHKQPAVFQMSYSLPLTTGVLCATALTMILQTFKWILNASPTDLVKL